MVAKERWIPEGNGWTEKNVSRLLDIWERECDLSEKMEARRDRQEERRLATEAAELEIRGREMAKQEANAQARLLDAQRKAQAEA